jgi:hypothetical protein
MSAIRHRDNNRSNSSGWHERCEWDPKRNRAGEYIPGSIDLGCQNYAVLSVGRGKDNWHLCESCAALPYFSRKKVRTKLQVPNGFTRDGQIAGDYLAAGRDPSLPRHAPEHVSRVVEKLSKVT